jgi:hypothetical protein
VESRMDRCGGHAKSREPSVGREQETAISAGRFLKNIPESFDSARACLSLSKGRTE